MKSFRIKYTLLKNLSGQTTGKICIELNGHSFPEEEWDDFIIVLCNIWLDNNNLLQGFDDVECTYPFMDGPLYFKLVGKGEALTLSAYHQAKKILEEMVLRNDVLIEVQNFAVSVLDDCNANDWNNEDISKLRLKLKR